MINEQIRDKEVRLIGADGEQLGIVSSKEAQKLADEAGLDLVKIAPIRRTSLSLICSLIINSLMALYLQNKNSG